MTEECSRIGIRIPGIFRFQALLSFGLSIWAFYPWPKTQTALTNAIEFVVTLFALSAIMCFLYFSYRVRYSSNGLYIRPGGWRALVGLGQEHFVAFDEIRRMTPEFARGGHGRADWLMFGELQLHTFHHRSDSDELVLRQVFLNREELVVLLQQLRTERPDIVDEDIINALANG